MIIIKIVGIYKIENIENGKIYIGESLDIYRRWEEHKNDLVNGTHHSYKLQQDFNNMGTKVFKFDILEEFELTYLPIQNPKFEFKVKMALICKESAYITKYNSINNGYNVENTVNAIINKERNLYGIRLNTKIDMTCDVFKAFSDDNSQLFNTDYKVTYDIFTINADSRDLGTTIDQFYTELVNSNIIGCNMTKSKFKDFLCDKKLFYFENGCYYILENSTKNRIFIYGRRNRNSKGTNYNTIILTPSGKEFLINKFKEFNAIA